MPFPTVPQPTDFPSSLNPQIHLPSGNTPANVILFLTGLGDTSSNFSGFAVALNLPDSVAITLQPPFPFPFPLQPGFNWSHDLQVDTSAGTIDPDSPLTKASDIIAEVILNVLMKQHNFRPEAIHLFGFGQGGSVAVSVVLNPNLSTLHPTGLGGVISVGGPLPLSAPHTNATKSRTPVLLLGGRCGAFARNAQSSVKRLRMLCEMVEYVEWEKGEDCLPRDREEVLPMMVFWARRLRDRKKGVPEGFVEIGL